MRPTTAFIDRTGVRYGTLVALRYIPGARRVGQRKPGRWECRCDCGKVVLVMSHNLDRQQSCGCKKSELLRQAALSRPPVKRTAASRARTRSNIEKRTGRKFHPMDLTFAFERDSEWEW